jgi:hypothetical protein
MIRRAVAHAALILLVAASASAQVLVIAWSVPTNAPTGGCPGSGGSPFYCDFQSNVLPWIDGVTLALNWAQSGADMTTCVTGGTCTTNYSLSTFDSAVVSQYYNATCGLYLRGNGGHKCIVNIVIQHVSNNSPNANTPSYVFRQEWANTPGTAPGWQPATLYYTNAVIKPNGSFWQETGASAIGYCTSGTAEPNFSGSSVSDGGCTWSSPSANAPPQDVVVCSSYQGTGMTVPGEWSLLNSSYSYTTLATGFPAIWENPYTSAYNQFHQYVIAHYSGVLWKSQIAYIRVGASLGGEVSTVCGQQLEALMLPLSSNAQFKLLWTGFAASSYAYNASQRLSQATVPAWYLMTAINCGSSLPTIGADCTWAQAEAAAAIAQPGYSYGAQGLQTSDLTGILYGTSCAAGNCCSNNWCNARNTAIGSVPLTELQECNISTAAGGGTGCLNDSSNPSFTLSQIFGLATQHGANVLEIYADDLLCAYDQSNYYLAQIPANTCTMPLSQGYQTAVQNLAVGQPSGTSTLSGKAQISGSAGAWGTLLQ